MAIIFLAGAEAFPDLVKQIKPKAVLLSYYYLREKKIDLEDFWVKSGQPKIFIDSGGFTIIVKGKRIDENYLKEYAEFIKKYEHIIHIYANVDTINPEETYKNQKFLEKLGIKPAPVFHANEPDTFLYRYLKEGYEKICIGGFVALTGKGAEIRKGKALKKSREEIRTQALGILNKIRAFCRELGRNYPKIHLFGLTTPANIRFMAKFIYSCDSTAWIGGKYGNFWYPRQNGYTLGHGHWKESKLSLKKLAEEMKNKGLMAEEEVNKVLEGDSALLKRVSLYAWKLFQERLERIEPNIERIKFEGDETEKEKIKMLKELAKDIGIRLSELVKGNKRRIKMFKNYLGLSVLTCNICPVANKCSFYQENSICWYEKDIIEKFGGLRDTESILAKLREMIIITYQRIMRGLRLELSEGGYPDKTITALINNYIKMLETYEKIRNPFPQVMLQQNVQNIEVQHQQIISPDILKTYEEVMNRWKEWKEKLLKKETK